MSEPKFDLIVDLDRPKEEILEKIAGVVKKEKDRLKKEGQVALNFLLKKKGEKDKTFVYNLNKEGWKESENNFVFPKVVEEVLKREFNPNIAKNEQLVNHVMDELKKDPYWSDRVVKLIKSFKESK